MFKKLQRLFPIVMVVGGLGSGTAAAQIPSDLHGQWSTSPKTCVENPADGPLVFGVNATGVGWYEFDCDMVSSQQTSQGVSLEVACFKGGGASGNGRISIHQMSPTSILVYSSPIGTFAAGWSDTFYRCASTPTPIAGPDYTKWMHNGSVMSLEVNGSNRRFFYERPRAGIIAQGVKPNTLLFYGDSIGNRYVGTAFIFNRKCGAHPYSVEGPILDGGSRVVLRGRAPRVNRHCQIFGYKEDVMEFLLVQ